MIRKPVEIITFLACSSAASVLGDSAAAMQPGTWKEIKTTGLTQGIVGSGSVVVTAYGDGAVWNPVARKFFYVGSWHGGPLRNLCYDEASNNWSLAAAPFSYGGSHIPVGHGYDHNAVDPATPAIFYRENNRGAVYEYNITSSQWSSLPSITDGNGSCGCASMSYFPEMKSLVLWDGGWGGLRMLRDGAGQWTTQALNVCGYTYHNFSEYNPVHKLILFGGGNGCREMYTLDSTGKTTKMKNAPVELGILRTVETVDPVTGDFLFFTVQGQFYVYNVRNDTWSLKSGPASIFDPPLINGDTDKLSGAVAASNSTHGVIMVLRPKYGQDPSLYLYKHSQSSGVEAFAALPANHPRIFPNPARRGAVLRMDGLSGVAHLAAYDTRGRKVKDLSLSNSADGVFSWDTESLACGIYMLKLRSAGTSFQQRVVVAP